MKKRRNIYLGLVVLIAIIASIPANIPANTTFAKGHSTQNYMIEKGEFHPKPMVLKVTKKIEEQKSMMPILENVPIADTSDDEKYPSIALCSGENLIAAYADQPDFLTSSVVFAYSTDGGNNWNYHPIPPNGYETEPCVAYRGVGNSAVACWTLDPTTYPAGNVVYLMNDTTDENTWRGAIWSWSDSYSFSNWHNFSLAGCYLSDYPEFWGVMSFIGDSDDDNYHLYATECPWVLTDGTKWYGAGYAVCELFPYWNHSRTTSTAIDSSAGKGYTVFDFFNEEVGTYSLGIVSYPLETIWDDESIWDRINISSNYFTSYSHPDISITGGIGYIACETNENGNKDIVCFYSTDGFNTVEKTFIANSPDNETNPSIVSYGEIAQCTFIRNGNIYITHTSDGGKTWSEPKQVNDQDGTVEEGWHFSKLTRGGNVAWTDTRNGNLDIYFNSMGVPAPIISIDSVSGGIGVKATISNVGSATAENLKWSIDLSGLVIIGKHSEGSISSLSPGESTTIKSGFVFGIGPVTAIVKAGGATKTAKGIMLGPLILGLS